MVFSLFLSDVIIKIIFWYRIVYNSIVVKLFIGPTWTLRRSEMTMRRGLRPGSNPGGARKAQKTQGILEQNKKFWAERAKDPWLINRFKQIGGDC